MAGDLPEDDASLMKLSPDPSRTIADIITSATKALALNRRHAHTLHRSVATRYDWIEVARKLAVELTSLASRP